MNEELHVGDGHAILRLLRRGSQGYFFTILLPPKENQ